ncbi:hypothetical protein [Pediococcus acidilactici]|uniref:hypothetical protein n=1 Tax=Pediococcus acidilactici TaxID=1254 RepID=UPI000BEEFAD0|nr:hypothetical protein [Pediococcus acidilactici]MCQ0050365.1 hypothetical protein [Pediococcus acidilactici]MCQ0052550.1 hypothetical protein [Pediococcus acidilactici]MCQ0054258.1 hypothetical protein [Pediococcus acidilactici]MCQ0061704.1 hypothetical protein [Pediococcus acidilactici]MCQ0068802.1 hypothetical protein [Pediococcus acidilactici]
MKNAYVVKLGNLYVYEVINPYYRMTSIAREACYLYYNEAKETAESIGGKVYRVVLEEVKS